MLFNSYEFILLFSPITFAGFYLLAQRGSGLDVGWLAGASLFLDTGLQWWLRPV